MEEASQLVDVEQTAPISGGVLAKSAKAKKPKKKGAA